MLGVKALGGSFVYRLTMFPFLIEDNTIKYLSKVEKLMYGEKGR